MLQFILPAIVILVAIIVIVAIVVRHFPQAASIDVGALPEEQEAAMKAALMERRLKRKILDTKNKMLPFLRKFGKFLKMSWEKVHGRVAQMEQRYRTKVDSMSSEQQEDVKQKIRRLLEEADKLTEEEKWSDGEKKYIEVLSWDAQNINAFMGLGEMYFEDRNFSQAQETFVYLIKLIRADKEGEEAISAFSTPLTDTQINEVFYDYAVCLQNDEEHPKAIEQVKIIVERDEKNPKFLDKLVELSILAKDRSTAFRTLSKLKEVNPENQKIESFEEQIFALPF